MKAVLISIQPYWVFLIIAKMMGWNIPQEKTVEVRKNYPKDEGWNKTAKIYCSKDKRSFSKIPKEYQPSMERFLGKVIGEFVCDSIDTVDVIDTALMRYLRINGKADMFFRQESCLDVDALYKYLLRSTGYGWHITQLKIYDEPKPLWKFMKCGAPSEKELDEELCSYCEQTEWGERRSYGTPTGPVMCEGAFCGEAYDLYLDEHFTLKRPPQSWCYVEEL